MLCHLCRAVTLLYCVVVLSIDPQSPLSSPSLANTRKYMCCTYMLYVFVCIKTLISTVRIHIQCCTMNICVCTQHTQIPTSTHLITLKANRFGSDRSGTQQRVWHSVVGSQVISQPVIQSIASRGFRTITQIVLCRVRRLHSSLVLTCSFSRLWLLSRVRVRFIFTQRIWISGSLRRPTCWKSSLRNSRTKFGRKYVCAQDVRYGVYCNLCVRIGIPVTCGFCLR